MEFARVDLITSSLPYIVTGMFSQDRPLHPGDAVQLAAQLAVLRDGTQWGRTVSAAWYDGGTFLGVTPALTTAEFWRRRKRGQTPMQIWGDAPWHATPEADVNLPPGYGRRLGLACDWAIHQIASAKRVAPPAGTGASYSVAGLAAGSNILDGGPGWRDGGTVFAGAPVVAAIIVAGAAVAVVGGVAAWRYFDPEVRREQARIAGAAAAYRERIRAWQDTGTMPPASDVERLPENVATVEAAANAASGAAWKWGLGVTLGTVAVAAAYGAATRFGSDSAA